MSRNRAGKLEKPPSFCKKTVVIFLTFITPWRLLFCKL